MVRSKLCIAVTSGVGLHFYAPERWRRELIILSESIETQSPLIEHFSTTTHKYYYYIMSIYYPRFTSSHKTLPHNKSQPSQSQKFQINGILCTSSWLPPFLYKYTTLWRQCSQTPSSFPRHCIVYRL